MLPNCMRYAIGPVPSVQVEWLYNPEGRTAWTIVPGLADVIVMISTLMLGALTLVRERERGSWETLLATPVDVIDALVENSRLTSLSARFRRQL
jgi:ABC-2 type transport system permease protein